MMTDEEKKEFVKYVLQGNTLEDDDVLKIINFYLTETEEKSNPDNNPLPKTKGKRKKKKKKGTNKDNILNIEIDSDEKKSDIEDVKLQLKLYLKLKEKRSTNGEPNIPDSIKHLIDLTRGDIEAQHERKIQIDARAGMLLASWGIIITFINNLNAEIITKNISVPICATLSAILCIQSIYTMKFKHFGFESKPNNFISTIENEEMYYIRVLAGLTNVWSDNEKKLKIKVKLFRCALIFTLIFSLAVIWIAYLS